MKIKFISGEPIQGSDQDKLGFLPFARHIYNAIHHVETPFVFGLYGAWGTGKSSVINLLKEQLGDGDRAAELYFVPIVIDAWKYDDEDRIVFPLFHALKTDYRRRFPSDDDETRFVERLFDVVAASAVALSDLGLRTLTKTVTGSSLNLSDVEKSLDLVKAEKREIESTLSTWADQVEQLNSKFQDLIDAFADRLQEETGVEAERVRFLIIIDDLDRCLPEAALSILEGVKNHLSAEKCIYLFSVNPTIIRRGIEAKYHGARVDSRQYLEKIIHYAFLMPEPSLEMVFQYTTEHFSAQFRDEQKASELADTFEQIGEAFRRLSVTNPRRIKRLTNRLVNFLTLLAFEKPADFDPQYLVSFTYVLEYQPDLFQFLLGQDDSRFIDHLRQVFEGTETSASLSDSWGIDVTSILDDPDLYRSIRGMTEHHPFQEFRALAVHLYLYSE